MSVICLYNNRSHNDHDNSRVAKPLLANAAGIIIVNAHESLILGQIRLLVFEDGLKSKLNNANFLKDFFKSLDTTSTLMIPFHKIFKCLISNALPPNLCDDKEKFTKCFGFWFSKRQHRLKCIKAKQYLFSNYRKIEQVLLPELMRSNSRFDAATFETCSIYINTSVTNDKKALKMLLTTSLMKN